MAKVCAKCLLQLTKISSLFIFPMSRARTRTACLLRHAINPRAWPKAMKRHCEVFLTFIIKGEIPLDGLAVSINIIYPVFQGSTARAMVAFMVNVIGKKLITGQLMMKRNDEGLLISESVSFMFVCSSWHSCKH